MHWFVVRGVMNRRNNSLYVYHSARGQFEIAKITVDVQLSYHFVRPMYASTPPHRIWLS